MSVHKLGIGIVCVLLQFNLSIEYTNDLFHIHRYNLYVYMHMYLQYFGLVAVSGVNA